MVPALILSFIILISLMAALVILPIVGFVFTDSLRDFIEKYISKSNYSHKINLIVFCLVAWVLIAIGTGSCSNAHSRQFFLHNSFYNFKFSFPIYFFLQCFNGISHRSCIHCANWWRMKNVQRMFELSLCEIWRCAVSLCTTFRLAFRVNVTQSKTNL